ncbi:5-(carboxyamino)imidazole ribonucleotide synthase [Salinibacillus kushneri]|uniref:N5-carboxyaminoimidazole ribonucleotide synthase n=1 Tax=Salinibacillus kushneri TaxID=237682 RepID=A0A1I0IW60_9BACI|nr:5-(carboxyamino)imidazole ribonucleotide synthase [Salinibacillus kushneri]SEU01582.1 5-(carboxyamino)imidazole ribonucleotide synthase [Salinibacillus kushneri]
MDMILPDSTIGIIGGGQLGRMMAIAAKEMGYKVAVLDPKENSPTGQIADFEIVAPYHDMEAARQLANISDVITYEFENIDYRVLLWLEQNANLPQGSSLIEVTQDRANEKRAIEQSGGKPVYYHLVNSETDVKQAVEKMGIPAVLKTRTGGYDGKGQIMIHTEADLKKAVTLLQKGPCILEQFIPFEKELSVIVHRNRDGELKTFPVGENTHKEHILIQTIVPAQIDANTRELAGTTAKNLAESLDMVGTLGVEMFLTSDAKIYINELAPRPHNSGHYTLNACETTQFQQHIRAICNWPLGSTAIRTPVVMMNILGEHLAKTLTAIPQMNGCHVHLYGKGEAKRKRKMGHINFIGKDHGTILENISAMQIWQEMKQGATL